MTQPPWLPFNSPTELNASASEKLWIVNIYALIAAGLLPGMGTIGDRLGHKHLFIGGQGEKALGYLGLFQVTRRQAEQLCR